MRHSYTQFCPSLLYCVLTITLSHISVDLLYYIRLRVYWGIILQQPVIEPYLISPSVRWSGFSEHSSFPCKIQNTSEHQNHLHTLETSEPSFPKETVRCVFLTQSLEVYHTSLGCLPPEFHGFPARTSPREHCQEQ